MRKRVGIYGGAFDPPHLAHEALARAAVDQYALDRLIILPTGQAWHKNRTLSLVMHRLAMAHLGFADVRGVQIDPRETQRSGATYTIDSLLELRAEHPEAELFLVMGQDQLALFPQWHRWQDILQIATLLVAFRADSMPAAEQEALKNSVKIEHSKISMPVMPTSASAIRQRAAQLLPIDHLVKPVVARYIAEHNLYESF